MAPLSKDQLRTGLALVPALGLQGKPFLCMSVLRKVGDPGAGRWSLGWWSFQDDLKVLNAWLSQGQSGRNCLPIVAAAITFPLTSEKSSTPQASIGHCLFSVPLVYLSMARRQIAFGIYVCFLIPPSTQLIMLRPLLALLPGKCQGGGAWTVREALSIGPPLQGTLRESNDQVHHHALHTPPGL